MSVTSRIRAIFSAPALNAEIDELKAEVKRLEDVARSRMSGPAFTEVATKIDCHWLEEKLAERAIEDLSPMLNDSATRFLQDALRGSLRDNTRPRSYALAAYDMTSRLVEVRFVVPQLNTQVQIYHDL